MAAQDQRGAIVTQIGARKIGLDAKHCAGQLIDSNGVNLRARWVAVVFATLLAFLCQSFVTQTHLHVVSSTHSAALASLSGTSTALETGQSSPDLPVCPICQEIAHGGSYLPPALIAFYGSEPSTVGRVVLPPLALTPSRFSHAWRSRAPPRHPTPER